MSEEFERAKACFEQNSEHIRSLNQIMWKVPLLAMTLTGGLWFAVATTPVLTRPAQVGFLLLAAIANIALVFVLARIRFVMQGYIERVKDFYEAGHPHTDHWLLRKNLVVCIFALVLTISGVGSLYAIWKDVFTTPPACLRSEPRE
jgi:hypothetical protein